ncbi:MAG: ABC transporter substrate-binding protein [Beijerinckiaceae bacterium]|nr:ABC transporter substrate-binding protein [Beijerinckiaceae bacterium]
MLLRRSGLREFTRRAALWCAALLGLSQPLGAQPLDLGPNARIASVNLCADQLLLALAPPARIAGLGPFARDRAVSFLADRAVLYPQLSGRSEELIMLHADAVMVGPFDNKFMRSVLERRGVFLLTVDQWRRIADVKSGVAEIATRIGESPAGEALVAEIDAALQRLRLLASLPGQAPSFLIVHRRGLVDDGGVLSEILAVAGLQDVFREGVAARFADVESILSMRPDFLVVANPGARAEDRGLELLQHPALTRLYPAERRVSAPDHLTICAGPSTPALIDHLRSQLEVLLQYR